MPQTHSENALTSTFPIFLLSTLPFALPFTYIFRLIFQGSILIPLASHSLSGIVPTPGNPFPSKQFASAFTNPEDESKVTVNQGGLRLCILINDLIISVVFI